MQSPLRFVIWGPSSGSSRITVEPDWLSQNRVRIVATTDFGKANCSFSLEQIEQLRDALNEVLGAG